MIDSEDVQVLFAIIEGKIRDPDRVRSALKAAGKQVRILSLLIDGAKDAFLDAWEDDAKHSRTCRESASWRGEASQL